MNTNFQTTIQKISGTLFSWFQNPVFQYVMTFLYSPIGWWALWKCGKQPLWLKALLTFTSLPFAFLNLFYLSWIGLPVLLFLYFTSRPVKKNTKTIASVLAIIPVLFSATLCFTTPSSSGTELRVADISSSVTSIEEISSLEPLLEIISSEEIVPSSETVAEPVIETPSQESPTEPETPATTPVQSTPPVASQTTQTPSTAPAPVSSTAPPTPQPREVETPSVENPAPANGGGNGNNFNTYSDTQATSAYVGNSNSSKFHKASCSQVKKMSPSNVVPFSTRDEAISAGYNPCGICNP